MTMAIVSNKVTTSLDS